MLMLMMRILAAIFLGTALIAPAAAQQADPAFLQKAIGAVQAQRNQAMDAAAVADVKISSLSEELAKAQARVKELEAKIEEKK